MADETLSLPFAPRPGVITKRCKRCKINKPVSEFHWRPDQNRHRTECKECYRAAYTARRDPEDNRRRVREWQKSNPEKRRAQGKRSYENSRGDLIRWIASNLKGSRAYCKRRGIPCSISAEDVAVIHTEQNGCCALSGRGLVIGSKGQQRDSISVDRIEPSLGYVLGNVRLVTYQANMARGPFSDDELFAFCEAVLATRAAVI